MVKDTNVEESPFIDNSRHVYIPVRLNCGIQAWCRPDVLSCHPMVLYDLNHDLAQCLHILPTSVHPLIYRTKVWVNVAYSTGRMANPKMLNHVTAHHHEAWLVWARDCPDKKLSIEVYNCLAYQRMRLHWNGCGLILHELCHLIHQHALRDGLENKQVKQAYARAQDNELYEQVLRRDWAGNDIDCDMAYALVDHREFFAELSVAYFSHGYEALDRENHSKMERVCPPILAPHVLARFSVNQKTTVPPPSQLQHQKMPPNRSTPSTNRPQPPLRPGPFGSKPIRYRMMHCNKFYPFTNGQLKHYDHETYCAIDSLWKEIAQWEDPHVQKDECCFGCLLPFRSTRSRLLSTECPNTVDL